MSYKPEFYGQNSHILIIIAGLNFSFIQKKFNPTFLNQIEAS